MNQNKLETLMVVAYFNKIIILPKLMWNDELSEVFHTTNLLVFHGEDWMVKKMSCEQVWG